jgi:hypothetical protein
MWLHWYPCSINTTGKIESPNSFVFSVVTDQRLHTTVDGITRKDSLRQRETNIRKRGSLWNQGAMLKIFILPYGIPGSQMLTFSLSWLLLLSSSFTIASVCLLAVALVLLVNPLSFLSPVSISIRIVHLFTVDSDARL